MEYKLQNKSMSEHKRFEISYALHMFLKSGPLYHSRPHCMIEKLHSLTVQKVSCGMKFLLLLNRVFSELFATHLKRYWSWFEAFPFLYIRDAGEACESRVLTHHSCCWGPLWKQSTYALQLLLGPFETKILTHCSCCWWPLWKQSPFTLHLLLSPFESKILTS